MQTKEIYVKVTKDGPYLVYGAPQITREIIMTDDNGTCMNYAQDKVFEIKTDPAAVCRCGMSKNSPFCDGTHIKEQFDGTETASFEPIINEAVRYKGPDLTLLDNEKYCAFARFCDANGSIWNLIYKGDEETDKECIKEANLCPAGRLMIFDNEGNLIEDKLEETVAILEDSGLKISGPLWLRGGIKVLSAEGKSYEIRNKQTLCRCGKSKNKPFCDSAHRHVKFKADYQ